MLSSVSSSCLRRAYFDSSKHATRVRHATTSTLDNLRTPRIHHPSNQVWKFKSDPRDEQKNSAALKKTGKSFFDGTFQRKMLPLCLEAAAKMKLKGTPPDRQTYQMLMESVTNAGAWRLGQAIIDDMLLVGIKPDSQIFSTLLHVRHRIFPKWSMTMKMTGTPSTMFSHYMEDFR